MKSALLILTALVAGSMPLTGSATGMQANPHHHSHKHHRHPHQYRHHLYTYQAAPGTTYSYSTVMPAARVVQPVPQAPVILAPYAPMPSAPVMPGFGGGMGPGGSGMPGSQSPGGIGR